MTSAKNPNPPQKPASKTFATIAVAFAIVVAIALGAWKMFGYFSDNKQHSQCEQDSSYQFGPGNIGEPLNKTIDPQSYSPPLVFILIGRDEKSRMNLFISSALHSQAFFVKNGVPLDNIIFMNDQDFNQADKNIYGEKLNRKDDKYDQHGWPANRTYYCNDRHWKNDQMTKDVCVTQGIRSLMQTIIKQKQALSTSKGKNLPIVFEFHGHGAPDGSMSFTDYRSSDQLYNPSTWKSFIEEFVTTSIFTSQKNYPILFVGKQCYAATFGQMLRNDISNSVKVKQTVQLVTVSGDLMVCPHTVLGSQATLFLHGWMRNLKSLEPNKKRNYFNVEYLTNDKNANNFANALASKKIFDVNYEKMAVQKPSGRPYPIQCREAFSPTKKKMFKKLPLSVFGLVQ